VAQNWQEYGYPDCSFRITFLADPQIKTTTYQVTDDREVEAHVYFVRRDNAEFKVTVAELADAGRESAAVINYAIKTLSKGGEVITLLITSCRSSAASSALWGRTASYQLPHQLPNQLPSLILRRAMTSEACRLRSLLTAEAPAAAVPVTAPRL
jgi:hypothetical protein